MITIEIKKLITLPLGGKSAQINFNMPGVGLLKGKNFMAWGIVPETAKVGDKAEISMEDYKQLTFEIKEMKDKVTGEVRLDADGKVMKVCRVKLG